MKKVMVTVLVLGVLGAGGYGAYRYFYAPPGEAGERVSSDSEDAVYVDLVSEITGYGSGNGLFARFGGEIEPQATLEVKLENERTVKTCYVKVGDEVKEGDELFVYDTQEDEDKLAQAEIDIEKAKGDIEVSNKAIAQFEKDKKSADADDQLSITTSILEEQNSIKRNEYDIKANELEIEQLKETIENATVTAEMDGIVQKISDPDQVGYGYMSDSGSDSAYITILAVGDYRVKGTVNEQNYSQIAVGDPMIVHSRVDESLTWTGTVSEIKTDADTDTDSGSYYSYSDNESGSSNYSFYVELDSSEGLLLGQHVYMEPDQGQSEEKTGLWLEEYYLMQEDGHAYVWMANKSNVLEKHEVTLGEYDEELMEYEILDGLEAEDYIAYPMDTIEEGSPVIYNEYSTPDMSGAAGLDALDEENWNEDADWEDLGDNLGDGDWEDIGEDPEDSGEE